MASARYCRILPYMPHTLRYARIEGLRNRLRERILKQPMMTLPTILAFEPAPIYMLGHSHTQSPSIFPWYKRVLPKHRKWARFKLDRAQFMGLIFEQTTRTWRDCSPNQPTDEHVERAAAAKAKHGRSCELIEHNCNPDLEQSSRLMSSYLGPGQAVMWPILDLRHPQFRISSEEGVEEWIGAVVLTWLMHKHGLRKLQQRIGSGIWISSSHFKEPRQIADISVRIEDHLVMAGLTLNLDIPLHGESCSNPAARMEKARLVFNPMTSVCVERGSYGRALERRKDVSMSRSMDSLAALFCQSMGCSLSGLAEHSTIIGDDWEDLVFGVGNTYRMA